MAKRPTSRVAEVTAPATCRACGQPTTHMVIELARPDQVIGVCGTACLATIALAAELDRQQETTP